MKNNVKKILALLGIAGVFSVTSVNSYAGLFSGGADGSVYWMMKDYYENLASKLQIMKDYELQLEKFKLQLEQWKTLPEALLRQKTEQLVNRINEMYKANQYTQGALKSTKKAEIAFNNLYNNLISSGNLKSYNSAIDNYYLQMKNIGADILAKNGQNQLAQKDFKTKMVALASELETAKNPNQLLNIIGRINQEMIVTLERVATLMEQTSSADRLTKARELAEQQAIEERNRATRESIKKSIKYHESQAQKYKRLRNK